MKDNRITAYDKLELGFTIGLAGMIVVAGGVLCLTIVGAVIGIPMILFAGHLPQRTLKRIYLKHDREAARLEQLALQEAKERLDRNLLDNVTTIPDEELPWLI